MSFLDIRVTARRRSDYHTRDTITTSTTRTHTRQYSVLWQRVDMSQENSEGGKKYSQEEEKPSPSEPVLGKDVSLGSHHVNHV
ncbi:hypothetical protein CEXT_727531 [Caerostris extrusa]|uniref:Uncharacterized protein n=1 Tax=Caerostris extrusa TaxID=172846 RepID=A0AAV4N674_CAEEX|nr:hypothetical protein CEXT_727531 [Caerostris extrusa]